MGYLSSPSARIPVLFFCPVPDFYGGAERVLVDLMANPAIEPHLCVPAEGPVSEAAKAQGIPYGIVEFRRVAHVRRPVRPTQLAAAAFDVVAAARALRPLADYFGCRIVHSNGLKPHVVTALARRFATTSWRFVAHFHDIPYTRLERGVWRLVTAAADGVIAVSSPCILDPTASHVHVVPNALAVPTSLRPRAAGRPLRLGFIGRYARFKGLHVLHDWYVAARDAGIDAELRLRGRPDPTDADYWSKVWRRMQASRYAASIIDEGYQDRRVLYDDLDVVIVSSDYPDPHPFVVKEAQAEGVPVIGYPTGGIPEMIAHGQTGFLAGGPAEFVRVLQQLRRDPALYERVRRAAWQHAHREFQMTQFYDRITRVYHDVLSDRRLPAPEPAPRQSAEA